MNKRLADREFLAGDYSIADMACYPWVLPERQNQDMANFPHLARWQAAMAARPAVERAYALAPKINPNAGRPPMSPDERKILFGQDQTTVR
jgi:GST-like protein